MSNVLGAIVFLDLSWALPPSWCASVDVESSDILWWESGEMRLRRTNLKKDTSRFKLVQALLENNNPTSNIVVLYCEKIGCPGWFVGCYLYRLENCLIDITSFRFCYNLNKRVSDWDFWLGMRSISWTAVAIGPLARITIMVSSAGVE
jgi:hypothetical protein